VKCKAEGKKCDAAMTKASGKMLIIKYSNYIKKNTADFSGVF
jgi:hypothetical protein